MKIWDGKCGFCDQNLENWQLWICYRSPTSFGYRSPIRSPIVCTRLLLFAVVRLSFAIVHVSFAIVHLSFTYRSTIVHLSFAIVRQIPRFCSPAVRYSSRFSRFCHSFFNHAPKSRFSEKHPKNQLTQPRLQLNPMKLGLHTPSVTNLSVNCCELLAFGT